MFPGVAVGVVAVAFPEAKAVVVEEHETANPFDAFPGVKVRDDESKRAAVIGGEGFAIVLGGEQDLRAEQVGKGDVGGVALVGKDQDVSGSGPGFGAIEDIGEADTFPMVVEAAPAGDTMKIACGFALRKGAKFFPGQAQGSFDEAGDFEVPSGRIENRNAAVVKNRPFDGERLAGGKAAFGLGALFFFAAAAVIAK